MCIKTRITHWRATGVLGIVIANILAVALIAAINFSMPFRVQQAMILAAISLMMGATLSAMYFSPQARQVRREIVERNRSRASQWK